MGYEAKLLSLFLLLTIVNSIIVPVPTLANLVAEESAIETVLTVQTDKPFYLFGENVQIFGTLQDLDGTAIEGATIAIEVKDPRDNTIFLDIVYSQSDGTYEDSFRLPSVLTPGRCHVFATAHKTGYVDSTAQNDFFVAIDDLLVIGVYSVQVVWDAKALIANKKTAMSIYIGNGFQQRVWTEINITYDFGTKSYMEIGPSGSGVPLDPGFNRVYIPGGPAFPANSLPWISADNPPWLSWTEVGLDGSIRATVDPYDRVSEENENNNEATTEMKIVESKTLKILCVPVYFPQLLQLPFVPPTNGEIEFLLGTYPVADNKFVWTQSPPIPWLGIPMGQEWLYWNVALPITLMAKVLGYDRAVIVIQDPNAWGIAIGMLRYPENRIPVIITNRALNALPGVLAHEIGHTYYLWHPHDLGPEVYDAYRFWAAKRDYETGPAPYMNTLMSYRSRLGLPLWIDKGRFDSDSKNWLEPGWYDFPGDPLDPGLPPRRGRLPFGTWQWNLFEQLRIGMDPEIIVVRGTIFKNGTVATTDPWYRLSEGTPELAPGTTGNYSIALLDNENQVLSQFGFNVSFTYLLDINGNLTEAETNSVPFIFNIPYLTGTSHIQIRNATGHILVSKTISSNSPTVTVMFPNGGEILQAGNNYTITWDASDLDGDTLSYTVAYSQDGGENWIPLALDVTENSYVWNTSTLRSGTNYLVKVITTDGVNSGEDISDSTFTVKIHDVTITDVTSSKVIVGEGYNVSISVTVANSGDFTETFNVTAYANTTSIGIREVTLGAGSNTTITFEWNTSGFPKGNYTVSALAIPVELEFYTADNTITNGVVMVTIPGDVNGDKVVEVRDLYIIGKVYNSIPTSPNWNPNADLNNDETVDTLDIEITSAHWGQSW